MNHRKALVTKLAYMSFIIKYYGYLHETAQMFRTLCKASKRVWDNSQKAILNTIVVAEKLRASLHLEYKISRCDVDYLLRGDKFNYLVITCSFKDCVSYMYMVKLLKGIKERNNALGVQNKDFLKKITIGMPEMGTNFAYFMENFRSLGINSECIQVMNYSAFENMASLKPSEFYDKITLPILQTNYQKLTKITDKCHVLSLDYFVPKNFSVLNKKYRVLRLEANKLSLVAKIMATLKDINTECQAVELLKFSENDCLGDLDKFLNFFPNIKTVIVAGNSSIETCLDANLFRKDWADTQTEKLYHYSERYRFPHLNKSELLNLKRINSLRLGSSICKKDCDLAFNRSNVKFAMKIGDEDDFYIFKADKFLLYCQNKDIFKSPDEILVIQQKSNINFQMEITNYYALWKQSDNNIPEDVCRDFRKLESLRGIEEEDICILDFNEEVVIQNSGVKVLNEISDSGQEYFLEAEICEDSLTHIDIDTWRSVCDLVEKLEGKFITLHLLRDSQNYIEKYLGLPIKINCINKLHNFLKEEERELLSELLLKLQNCHVLDFTCDLILPETESFAFSFCEFLISSPILTTLRINLPSEMPVWNVLNMLEKNLMIKKCILDTTSISKEEIEMTKKFQRKRIASEVIIIHKNRKLYPEGKLSKWREHFDIYEELYLYRS
ncbi:unnamed protein product [Moneuplotes crassus]|uniref:Uncharacterized protein n=1 Tax=Euplotes crassus TaxID=5936 RepID=A0AAD2DBR7_EUPCR|nr:unnamed protein product [Moneuplotes crassus]